MPFDIVLDKTAAYPSVLLIDLSTGTEAEIFCFGGLLNSFRILLKEGVMHNVIDGFRDVADAQEHITNGFKSTKLSPFVCRMNKGVYHFGGRYFEVKKYFLAGHAIHGLLYDAVYKITYLERAESFATVTLVHEYEGTDPGYPFPYNISITWTLEAGNRLTVSTTLQHQNEAAIPVADGWHPYFSLGSGIDDCSLQFTDTDLLEYDTELLPTGNKSPESRFDKGLLLRDVQLDNGFEWKHPSASNQCIVSNEKMRITIEPDISYPVLQIYIPPHRQSIAIENLSGAPDNFNNGMHLVILEPGQSKRFTTHYSVDLL